MKIYCLPDTISSWNKKEEEIKEYFLTESTKKQNISEPFSFRGKFYAPCQLNHADNVCMVREFKEPEEGPEDIYEDEITCPYCGNVDTDSWECSDSGEEVCSDCQSTFSYEINVSVSYNCTPIKKSKINELLS